MSSFIKKGNRSFNKNGFNKNERLTIDWVASESKKGKPIFTDEVISTIGTNGLKKVTKELEKRNILTFTNYSDDVVVFVRKNSKNLTFKQDSNWRVGFIRENDNIMILPTTPLSI
jgi:hypothetical protein